MEYREHEKCAGKPHPCSMMHCVLTKILNLVVRLAAPLVCETWEKQVYLTGSE